MTDDVGFDEVAGPPSPRRRGRHRRRRRNPLLFVVPTGALLALAVSVAVGSRSSEDPALPAQPSPDIAQEPDAWPDPSWLTPSDTPTGEEPAVPVPTSPTPTDESESPAFAPPPEAPASGPVAPTTTSSPQDEPPGHSATGRGNKPATPPGHSKRTPSPVPSDIS